MIERYEIRLTGSGGQGLGMAGLVLAECLALEQNMQAVMTQAYGPEARGGASKSEVVTSHRDIHYPKAISPDFLLALNTESFRKFGNDTKPNALILVESTAYQSGYGLQTDHIYCVPMVDIIMKLSGRQTAVNAVALGALAELLDFVDVDALERVMVRRFPRHFETANRQAFQAGRQYMIEKSREELHPRRFSEDFQDQGCEDLEWHQSEE
jgi:2-oxoglutarate ferredoxin oxidoreductase subunit gamma